MSNSFNIVHCQKIGCQKVIEGVACVAYRDPTILPWARHGEDCPVGPYQAKKSVAKIRVGQQKQKKGI